MIDFEKNNEDFETKNNIKKRQKKNATVFDGTGHAIIKKQKKQETVIYEEIIIKENTNFNLPVTMSMISVKS
jgi:hypothetical protein